MVDGGVDDIKKVMSSASKKFPQRRSKPAVVSKVIIEKSRSEVSLMELNFQKSIVVANIIPENMISEKFKFRMILIYTMK